MCLPLALSVCMPLSPQCLEGSPVQDENLKPIQNVPDLTGRLNFTKVPSAPDFPQTVGSPYSALPTCPFQVATAHWATPRAPNLGLPSTASCLPCCQRCPSLPPLGQCGNCFYAWLSYAFLHSCPSRPVASALFRTTQAPTPKATWVTCSVLRLGGPCALAQSSDHLCDDGLTPSSLSTTLIAACPPAPPCVFLGPRHHLRECFRILFAGLP